MHHALLYVALMGLQAEPAPKPLTYVTTAGFAEGRCQYFTGDVALGAKEFRRDLKERYDTRNKVAVYHFANVPSRCVKKAMSVLDGLGFKQVEEQVGGVDMGPPR